MKKIFLILVGAVILAVLALLIYEVANENLNASNVVRATLIIASCVCTIIRIANGNGKPTKASYATYEHQYKHIIRKAFTNPEKAKLKKKLLHCIDLFNKGQYHAAIKQLNQLYKSCQFTDDYCAVLTFLALCYDNSGDTNTAIETYHKVLDHNEDFSTVWSNLCILYSDEGKYEKAIYCAEKAILYDNQNALAYNNLAYAYYRRGNYELAIKYAKIALDKNGKTYQAATLLCLTYHLLNNTEESDKYYKLAIANGQNANKLNSAKSNLKQETQGL